MKTARHRIDVNLEELDRVLDDARQAPLSEADHNKLKDTLHALAAMLIRSRNTEKTSVVLEKPEDSRADTGTQADNNTPPPPGYSRNGAEAFAGERKVAIKHQKLTHGDRCRSVEVATYTGRRSRRCWCGSLVRRRWLLQFTRSKGCAAALAGRCSRRRSRKE